MRRHTHAQPKRFLITDCKIWSVSYFLFFLFQPSLSHLLRAPRYLPETDILQRYFLSATEIHIFLFSCHFLQNSFDHFVNTSAVQQTASADGVLVLALLNHLPQTPHTSPEEGWWWLSAAPWHISVAVLWLVSHP